MTKKFIPDRFYFWLFKQMTWLAVLILLLTMVTLLGQGGSILSWQFVSKNWVHTNITQGGIYPAIVGSVILGLGVMIVSFPVGFFTALYLHEYLKIGRLKRILILVIRNLAGIPSIVYGMFGLALFVKFFGFGSSLLSAILTLSLMALPWIVTATIESLSALPRSWREASFGFGSNSVANHAVRNYAGVLAHQFDWGVLANARAMGETAPIIVVGATFYLSKLPNSLDDKFMALPYHIFILSTQHSSTYAMNYAAATSLVLIFISFGLSLLGMSLRYYLRKKLES